MRHFLTLLTLLTLLPLATKSQCDYRPTLHPPAEVVFVVPDRTLGHLVSPEAWKGIENLLDQHSANADTRMAIVQYGRDGRRGVEGRRRAVAGAVHAHGRVRHPRAARQAGQPLRPGPKQ